MKVGTMLLNFSRNLSGRRISSIPPRCTDPVTKNKKLKKRQGKCRIGNRRENKSKKMKNKNDRQIKMLINMNLKISTSVPAAN